MSLQKEKIVARDRDHLRQIVFESIEKYGPKLKGRPLEWCKNLEEKWQKNHPPVSNEELDDDLPF